MKQPTYTSSIWIMGTLAFVGSMAMLLSLMVILRTFLIEQTRTEVTHHLLQVAKSLSTLVDPQVHREVLAGAPVQVSDRSVALIERAAREYRNIDFIYTLVKRDDRVYFGLLPYGDVAAARGIEMGTPYGANLSVITDVIEKNRAVITRLPPSSWNQLVNAYVPLTDDDQVYAVLGVDISASVYVDKYRTIDQLMTILTLISLVMSLGLAAAISTTVRAVDRFEHARFSATNSKNQQDTIEM